MAVGRPFWKGYLKLSLVSCPIAMFPASSTSERVSFRQINKKTGHRLKQQLVDAETGEVVENQDKGRGYEIGKNEYLPVEDEELDNLALESTHTIEIEKFVDRSEIDERYLDSPYYIVPEDKVGQEAFAVIRDAMKRKNMVGLGRVVLSRRERIVMLESFEKGLMATTLRYAYEIRDAGPYFEDIPTIKLPGEMVELAGHILETKAGHFDPAEFQDRYETAVVEMLKQKQAGMPPKKEAPAAPRPQVINLMEALRRSIEGGRPPGKKEKAGEPRGEHVKVNRQASKGARKVG
jgi:DNA end-binding protein Ku